VRLLVLQLARLGDLVQTWPLLRQVRLTFPGARVELLADRRLQGLRQVGPPVDEWWELDLEGLAILASREPEKLYNRLNDIIAALRANSYDLVFNLNFSRLSLLLSHLLQAPVRGNLPGAGGREVFREPWLALAFALAHSRTFNRLHLSDVFRHLAGPEVASPWPQPPGRPGAEAHIALQLGTRHPKRTWPLEFFSRLAERMIKDLDATVWLLGTAAERPLGEALRRSLPPALRERLVNLQGRTDLPELAAHLGQVSLVVSGDTGTLHLAAALGALTVGVFFGPASCFETGPYGVGHYVFQAEPPCHPCGEAASPCEEPFCAAMVPPEAVAALAAALLQGEPPEVPVLPRGTRLYQSGGDALGVRYEPLAGAWRFQDVVGLAYRRAAARLVDLELTAALPPGASLPPGDQEQLTWWLTALGNGSTPHGLPPEAARALRPLAAFRRTLERQQHLGWPGDGAFWWRQVTAALREGLDRHEYLMAR
jgi:ADP-heptose:LPS heptosyltransferase